MMPRVTNRRAAALRPPQPRRLRRHGRRWPWAVAALVPLAAAGYWWSTVDRGLQPVMAAAQPPSVETQLMTFNAPTGQRTSGPQCWMVVVDESSSMASADAVGSRAAAVEAAAEFLDQYGIDGDLIGATWFADAAEVIAPTRPDLASVRPSGTVELGGGTYMSNALSAAIASMTAGCGAAQPVLVLVSDGAGDLDATADALAAAPRIRVHLLAMNGAQAFEPSRAFWEDPAIGVASIEELGSFSVDEMSAAVAAVLSNETGQGVTAT